MKTHASKYLAMIHEEARLDNLERPDKGGQRRGTVNRPELSGGVLV